MLNILTKKSTEGSHSEDFSLQNYKLLLVPMPEYYVVKTILVPIFDFAQKPNYTGTGLSE